MGTARRRFGVLAGGDDYPGLNGVIRAAVLRGAQAHEADFVGFVDGWRGVLDVQTIELGWRAVRGAAAAPGTVLGASPHSDAVAPPDLDALVAGVRMSNLDGLLMVGGEQTMSVAESLSRAGVPVLAVPTSVENALGCTEQALGFDTVVGVGAEAMSRLRAVGDAQQRCVVAEVIGRDAGWIALYAALAASADVVLIPEWPQTSEQIRERLGITARRGHLVVVAEGFALAAESSQEEGAGRRLRQIIESHTGVEPLVSGLAPVQRGAAPTAADRVLAAQLGYAAADALVRGRHGAMATVAGHDVRLSTLEERGRSRSVSLEQYRRFQSLLG
ncbi:6-phosphofructokinase [Microbacterium xanthum]|uniref:6-phosphofructokinase n=1 Tax=Microbacterium xanthum TaxID=3079794 RepID=UPI002AD3BF75|nr:MULTISPECIES: 6-phosphofructokinase [unclassified Microbacterium]MDZ8170807.1 6-phosphofructokinase [Microbacterium sp. KSW-48]MDZ8201316.1 6-phosphofructokinase [Microbacterium sp. SSW1-59]